MYHITVWKVADLNTKWHLPIVSFILWGEKCVKSSYPCKHSDFLNLRCSYSASQSVTSDCEVEPHQWEERKSPSMSGIKERSHLGHVYFLDCVVWVLAHLLKTKQNKNRNTLLSYPDFVCSFMWHWGYSSFLRMWNTKTCSTELCCGRVLTCQWGQWIGEVPGQWPCLFPVNWSSTGNRFLQNPASMENWHNNKVIHFAELLWSE
jgi:hypothetical protein